MNNELTLVGALAVAVTALAGIITYSLKFLSAKLFDPDKGLFTVVAMRHVKFVDESSEALRINSDALQTIGIAIKEIGTATKRTAEATEHQELTNEKIATLIDRHHVELLSFSQRFPNTDDFSTVRTNEAIHHLARAGRAHLDGHDEQCRKELDEAEKAVNGKND
jgi:hypothetical protein